MIDHRAMAIMMAVHPEMIAMCENIIATPTQEIQIMQAWLCEWYEVCNYRKNL